MNIAEKIVPSIAIIRNNCVLSFVLFMVTRVDAQVKKYPIDAPIADMSRNHPSASRPRTGPDNEMSIQKIIEFFGVPLFVSISPNQEGRNPSRLIEYIRRLDARKKPMMPDRTAQETPVPISILPKTPSSSSAAISRTHSPAMTLSGQFSRARAETVLFEIYTKHPKAMAIVPEFCFNNYGI